MSTTIQVTTTLQAPAVYSKQLSMLLVDKVMHLLEKMKASTFLNAEQKALLDSWEKKYLPLFQDLDSDQKKNDASTALAFLWIKVIFPSVPELDHSALMNEWMASEESFKRLLREFIPENQIDEFLEKYQRYEGERKLLKKQSEMTQAFFEQQIQQVCEDRNHLKNALLEMENGSDAKLLEVNDEISQKKQEAQIQGADLVKKVLESSEQLTQVAKEWASLSDELAEENKSYQVSLKKSETAMKRLMRIQQ